MFSGDLTTKIRKNVISLDTVCRPCNCSAPSRTANGKCAYEGCCRHTGIVYEVKCKNTGKSYIGCTQQTLNREWVVILLT